MKMSAFIINYARWCWATQLRCVPMLNLTHRILRFSPHFQLVFHSFDTFVSANICKLIATTKEIFGKKNVLEGIRNGQPIVQVWYDLCWRTCSTQYSHIRLLFSSRNREWPAKCSRLMSKIADTKSLSTRQKNMDNWLHANQINSIAIRRYEVSSSSTQSTPIQMRHHLIYKTSVESLQCIRCDAYATNLIRKRQLGW